MCRFAALFALISTELINVVKEGEELVELALRYRIELVVVTTGTTQGQTQKDSPCRIDAINDRFDPVLLKIDASFHVDEGIAMETGRNELFGCRIREQVTCNLLGHEPVKRQVTVQGVNDPVSIHPNFAGIINVIAVGISVPSQVQPVTTPTFSIMRRAQQTLDQFLISIRAIVCKKSIHLSGFRQQAKQVEARAFESGSLSPLQVLG